VLKKLTNEENKNIKAGIFWGAPTMSDCYYRCPDFCPDEPISELNNKQSFYNANVEYLTCIE
jgi:hypothetical protein